MLFYMDKKWLPGVWEETAVKNEHRKGGTLTPTSVLSIKVSDIITAKFSFMLYLKVRGSILQNGFYNATIYSKVFRDGLIFN